MDGQKRGKKRLKSHYPKRAAGGKRQKGTTYIEPGMKGFLVTCNRFERETVREMYTILNEYANKLYGPEKLGGNAQQRRFQNTHTKTKNIIFIRSTIDDPCHLVHSMFEDLHENQIQKARYAQRIIPVSIICNIDLASIETGMKTVLTPLFGTDSGVGVKYTAICKVRNNEAMSGIRLLPLLYKIIEEMNPLHELCHDKPDWVVMIETMRKVCCLSVVKDFSKFRKFNFHEIVKKVAGQADGDEENKTSGKSEVKDGDGENETVNDTTNEKADGDEEHENCVKSVVKDCDDKSEPVNDITNEMAVGNEENEICVKSEVKDGNDKSKPVNDNIKAVNVTTDKESKELSTENDNVNSELVENSIGEEEEKGNAVYSPLEKIDQSSENVSMDIVEANKCNEDNGVKVIKKLEGSIDLREENSEIDKKLSDDVVGNT